MSKEVYIIEYDLYVTRIKDRDFYKKHMIEKRESQKAFEELVSNISNDFMVVYNSIKKYKATEI